jgi:hypothetical protein
LEDGKPPKKVTNHKTVKVGDHYKRFDPADTGYVLWKSLKIITKHIEYSYRPPGDKKDKKPPAVDKCTICKKDIEADERHHTVKECGHKFHEDCSGKLKALGIECPVCFI